MHRSNNVSDPESENEDHTAEKHIEHRQSRTSVSKDQHCHAGSTDTLQCMADTCASDGELPAPVSFRCSLSAPASMRILADDRRKLFPV